MRILAANIIGLTGFILVAHHLIGIIPPIEPLWVFCAIIWSLFCTGWLLMAISLRPKPTYLPKDKRHSKSFHKPLVTYEENLRHFGTNSPPIPRQVIPIPHTHYSAAPGSRTHQPVRRDSITPSPKRMAYQGTMSPVSPRTRERVRRDARMPTIPSLDRLADRLKVDDTPSRISRELIPSGMRSSAPPNSRRAKPPSTFVDDDEKEVTDTFHV
ncbi:MAG: hypothetical protein HN348_29065 [Proteobacteria bacterium]|nr:hypothetical protein [Pseudomonadota bacterium]